MTERRSLMVLGWFAAAVLTALYVYSLVAAIGNAVGMPMIAESLGLQLSAIGIISVSVGIAIPVIVFGTALVMGRSRPFGTRILILAAGLCLVAVLQLDILHVIPRASYFG